MSHMSRSASASAFKAKVGTAPLTYLIEWRMSLARDALRNDSRSISELAAATGYESESAFSTAFRRVVVASPRHFRDEARHPGKGGIAAPAHTPAVRPANAGSACDEGLRDRRADCRRTALGAPRVLLLHGVGARLVHEDGDVGRRHPRQRATDG
ncbi:helix-turn-helix transcriptional regulator [Streptomyces californicus]|uniref:helix-turn-helix transcriptional regulator n=1 Tax=Streptomyces californicus TaxID=67351 RepID=UPI00367C316C